MMRIAIRLAVNPIGGVSIWNLVPSLAMLVMCLFLPATIKRIVGQGQPGVGALVTAVQMAAGMKFLALGGALGAKAAATPPTAAAAPQAPTGPSAYPLATVPSSGVAGYNGSGGSYGQQSSAPAARAFLEGTRAAQPVGLPEPWGADQAVIDIKERVPGSGEFNQVLAVRKFEQGKRDFEQRPQDPPGGES
jgi:hypothetical protein